MNVIQMRGIFEMKRFFVVGFYGIIVFLSVFTLAGTVFADGKWIVTDKGVKVWDADAASGRFCHLVRDCRYGRLCGWKGYLAMVF